MKARTARRKKPAILSTAKNVSIFKAYPPELFQRMEEQQERAREMKRNAALMHETALEMRDRCFPSKRQIVVRRDGDNR